MIQGVVNASLEAVVSLTVQGPTGHTREIEAVIDTGFSGSLTLPPPLVAELGLVFEGMGWAFLADGTEARFDVHSVTMLWDERPRHVYAYAADATPLVGMRLLHHHNLNIDVEDGGQVAIHTKE